MITDTLLNGLKSLFSTLGAKTTDDNYAVGLFDKTTAEPKGLMDMPNLALVLGVNPYPRSAGSDLGIDTYVSSINSIWGASYLFLVSGDADSGLYLITTNTDGTLNVTALKAHKNVSFFSVDQTTKHILINATNHITFRVFHNNV